MRILIAGLLLVLFMACSSGNKTEEQAFLEGLDTIKIEAAVSVEIGDILHRIPSPLEISVLLKKSGRTYNASFLNSPDNQSRYNSNFKRALNLGIYGTDLGYTNIYEQSQDGIKYMATIKDLADGLNIGQFFQLETIARLATNSNNLDSLLLITTQNFNTINQYLHSQSRSNLSVLLLTGGWLEALHITCEVAKANPENDQLHEAIGGQKIILENIMLLLSFYKEHDPNMASLLADMEGLKQSFDKVVITSIYKESTFEIVNGVMIIKDNSSSTIDITPSDIEDIRARTQNIRTKIIS